jgi:hypothetical protein
MNHADQTFSLQNDETAGQIKFILHRKPYRLVSKSILLKEVPLCVCVCVCVCVYTHMHTCSTRKIPKPKFFSIRKCRVLWKGFLSFSNFSVTTVIHSRTWTIRSTKQWTTFYCIKMYSPWQANSHSSSQETSHLLWNPKVHYCVHKSLPILRPCVTFCNKLFFSGEELLAPCPTP